MNHFLRLFSFTCMFMVYLALILPDSHAQTVPFSRGVNLAYWFEAGSAEKIKFTQYTKVDLENIKSLGCDVVRIPVHFPNMTSGADDYNVNPLFYALFDQVVEWCDELEMYLILDNHSSGEIGTPTGPEIGPLLEKIWRQVALHYKDASPYLMYEILNEPHDIDNEVWNSAQQDVLAAIREIDRDHTIILSPSNWDNFRNLDSLDVYNDDNVLYTFHFYEPHLFTAQGTANSNFETASGVPFPYSAETMPACPQEYLGTWKEQYWQTYAWLGTVDSVKKLMNIAVDFAETRNVKVFCGEFGSLSTSCPPEDRVFWYNTLRTAFEERNIPWLIWDYHSAMGIFNRGDYYGLFDHDLNVPLVEALGFFVPPQTPLNILPDHEGFPVYLDYVDPDIRERSYTSGNLNFFSTDQPYDGLYCLKWSGATTYNSMVFGFNPVKDLSWLAANSYVLSFRVKGNAPGTNLQVRFIDTKTNDPSDHPWRMSKNVNVTSDNNWHLITLPLSEFVETGSWDNNTWHNPEGLFDWSAIDQLEIATEQWSMGENTIYFDNLLVSTAEQTNTDGTLASHSDDLLIQYSKENHLLTLISQDRRDIGFSLVDIMGRTCSSGHFSHTCTINTGKLPEGVYLLRYSSGKDMLVMKINLF